MEEGKKLPKELEGLSEMELLYIAPEYVPAMFLARVKRMAKEQEQEKALASDKTGISK